MTSNAVSPMPAFASLDIESDGTVIWQFALACSDLPDAWCVERTNPTPAQIQDHINRFLPGRILTGHNLREWDLKTLLRNGIVIPEDTEIWDTLETERSLCSERSRPTFALKSDHDALADARITLKLAQNQWTRLNASVAAAEAAWRESSRYYLVPDPVWRRIEGCPSLAQLPWLEIEQTFRAINERKMLKAIEDVTWRIPGHPPGKDGTGNVPYQPFNPASPKRIEYWLRLLPAIEAEADNGRAILFVQHKSEIDPLKRILRHSITGDRRSGLRRIGTVGGILILHESEWAPTLSEGVPHGTSLILERAPERVSDVIQAETAQVEEPEDGSEDEPLVSDVDLLKSGGQLAVTRPEPDVFEIGRMALWLRESSTASFHCLDARLWNRRAEMPFATVPVPVKRRSSVTYEEMVFAGFTQTSGEFHLPEQSVWSTEISRMFDVPALHAFQEKSLAAILLRKGISCAYVERATGGGKSLIFQAAGLYRGEKTGRITIVISPLRALIHDQTTKLHQQGFALDVEALSGDMSRTDIEDAYRRIAGGETKLVFTAPERFRSPGFLAAIETRFSLDPGGEPEYWVFDEAHCISMWGLEFRPDYRKAAEYIRSRRSANALPNGAPVLLVSATLTALAKQDIEAVLGVSPARQR